MNIRCANCGLEFAHDPPPFTEVSQASCPRCGQTNEVGGEFDPGAPTEFTAMPQDDTGVGAAAVPDADQVFCFNCGKPMRANPQELIPVCDECKAGSAASDGGPPAPAPPPPTPADAGPASIGPAAPAGAPEPEPAAAAPSAELMVRKSNGQVYGPFPESTIVDWIKAGKIQADEEVSRIGGAWRSFADHDEFSSYFPDAKKPAKVESEEVQFKKVNPAKESLLGGAKVIVAVAFVVIVGIVVYYLISRGTFTLPGGLLGGDGDGAASGQEEPVEDPDLASGQTTQLIRDLQSRHADAEGSSFEHYYRGRELMRKGNLADIREAVVEMEQAVALDPANAAALAGLGEVYNHMADVDQASANLRQSSFYFIDRALEMTEYRLESNRAKAWFLYYTEHYSDAATHVRAALAVDAADPESHMLMGLCEFGMSGKVTQDVRAHFDKALEVDPTFDRAHYELGRCLEKSRRYRPALEAYARKAEADPTFINVHYRTGRLYEDLGDYGAAATAYERVLQMDRTHKETILRLGRILTQIDGATGKAVSLYARLDGEDAPALSRSEQVEYGIGRASALRLHGDPASACAAIEGALAVDATRIAAQFEKAMCESAQGHTDEATRAIAEAINLGTSLDERRLGRLEFYRGWIYYQGGQMPDALESFERVHDLDVGFAPAYVFESSVYAKLGQVDRVKGALRGLRDSDPVGYRRPTRVLDVWAPIPSMATPCADVSAAVVDVNFDPELFGLAGGACYYAADHERASKYIERCLSDAPTSWSGLLYSALIDWDQGDIGAALLHLDELTGEHRDVGSFHLLEADALLKTNDLPGAERALNAAKRYDRTSAWAHHQMGQLYLRTERADDAREEFNQARKLDPTLLGPRLALFENDL